MSSFLLYTYLCETNLELVFEKISCKISKNWIFSKLIGLGLNCTYKFEVRFTKSPSAGRERNKVLEDLEKNNFLWALRFWDYWIGGKSTSIPTNLKLQQDTLNQIFNKCIIFLPFDMCYMILPWYLHSIYIFCIIYQL